MSTVRHRGGVAKAVPNAKKANEANHSKKIQRQTNVGRHFQHHFLSLNFPNASVVGLFFVVFFALYANDMFLQLPRTSKYATLDDFNVPHANITLGALGSTFLSFASSGNLSASAWLTQSYLAWSVVILKTPPKYALLGLPALNGALYFVSQVDNYQHHYFLFLLLVIIGIQGTDDKNQLTFLIVLQTSVVYFWTIVCKIDTPWLSGKLFPRMVSPWTNTMVAPLVSSKILGLDFWFLIANISILTEMLLLVLLWVSLTREMGSSWLRYITAFIGMSFHFGINQVGLGIGLFSYYMMALYLLYAPIPKALLSFDVDHYLPTTLTASWIKFAFTLVPSTVLLALPVPGSRIAAMAIAICSFMNFRTDRFTLLQVTFAVLLLWHLHPMSSDVLVDIHSGIAQEMMTQGKVDQGMAYFDFVSKTFPTSVEAHIKMSVYALAFKREEHGMAVLKKVLDDMNPKPAPKLFAISNLARIHFSSNEKTLACDYAKQMPDLIEAVTRHEGKCATIQCDKDVRMGKTFSTRVFQTITSRFDC